MSEQNRVAVITGGGRGIGAATALKLAKDGIKVAIFDLDEDNAQEIVSNIKELGSEAIAVRVNVANRNEVEEGMRKVIDTFGRLDILVNNAGVIRDNLIHKMTEEDWDVVVDIHLKGSFLCSQAAQKYMVKQKYGKIVMISSLSALGNRGQVNYSSVKAGLQAMAKTLSIELGPFGINVNAVAPGFIETDMTKATAKRMGIDFEQAKQNYVKNNPIKRVGIPKDVANLVAFLTSDEASYITGQVVYIAGSPVV